MPTYNQALTEQEKLLANSTPVVEGKTVRALCVDLDGTLVKSDTLVDSVLLLVRTHPLQAALAPLWLRGGKAAFKAQLASRVTLDVSHLPWNRQLLDYLAGQHAMGRKLYHNSTIPAWPSRSQTILGFFRRCWPATGRRTVRAITNWQVFRSGFQTRVLIT